MYIRVKTAYHAGAAESAEEPEETEPEEAVVEPEEAEEQPEEAEAEPGGEGDPAAEAEEGEAADGEDAREEEGGADEELADDGLAEEDLSDEAEWEKSLQGEGEGEAGWELEEGDGDAGAEQEAAEEEAAAEEDDGAAVDDEAAAEAEGDAAISHAHRREGPRLQRYTNRTILKHYGYALWARAPSRQGDCRAARSRPSGNEPTSPEAPRVAVGCAGRLRGQEEAPAAPLLPRVAAAADAVGRRSRLQQRGAPLLRIGLPPPLGLRPPHRMPGCSIHAPA